MATDWAINDAAVAVKLTPNQGKVLLLNCPIFELLRQDR
jgi:hypothetical protein